MHRHVVIVAGGNGSRMRSEVPKQFMLLDGKPVLMHTMERFHEADPGLRILLVIPSAHMHTWSDLCEEHNFNIRHTLVAGGDTRFHSVRRGLQALEGDLVAIHDGVRPLLSVDLIRRVFITAEEKGSAIPAVPVTDSVRQKLGGRTQPIDRSTVLLVQTPQCFDAKMLKQAYNQPYRESFTDCASVVEAAGFPVEIVDGDPDNIKITTQRDLMLAGWILSNRKGTSKG